MALPSLIDAHPHLRLPVLQNIATGAILEDDAMSDGSCAYRGVLFSFCAIRTDGLRLRGKPTDARAYSQRVHPTRIPQDGNPRRRNGPRVENGGPSGDNKGHLRLGGVLTKVWGLSQVLTKPPGFNLCFLGHQVSRSLFLCISRSKPLDTTPPNKP